MSDALISWVLIASLAPGAVPSAAPTSEPSAEDPAIGEAEALYQQGLASYEVFDYDDAIEHWKNALAKLPASSTHAKSRNAIVYNIAQAQEKAFEQDHDVVRLHKAKALLERYVEEETAAGSVDGADVTKARTRIAELERRIAEVEAADRKPEPRTEPLAPSPIDDEGPHRSPRQRALLGSGAALLTLGVGAVVAGVTTGGLMTRRASERLPALDQLGDEDQRANEIDRGNTGKTVAIACGVAGGALAVVGIGLLIAGVKRRKHERTAWTPALAPGHVGLAFAGRF